MLPRTLVISQTLGSHLVVYAEEIQWIVGRQLTEEEMTVVMALEIVVMVAVNAELPFDWKVRVVIQETMIRETCLDCAEPLALGLA